MACVNHALGRAARRAAPTGVAVAISTAFLFAARSPVLPPQELAALAQRFAFDRLPITPLPSRSDRTIRLVHPRLSHLAGWISAVGASIALGDVDGDGLPNDYCAVDPRTDRVFVGGVPAGRRRFETFLIDGPFAEREAFIAPMGCRIADLNEDGRSDLIVYYWGAPPHAWLRRAPAAGEADTHPLDSSSYRAVSLASEGARWNTNALTTADVDGDGHLDLIVGNYFPDGSMPLDGRGVRPIEMQTSMSRAFNGGRNRVLLWTHATSGREPTVSFRDVDDALPPEIADGWTLAVAAADLDGDLLPEVYVANDFGPDRLLHNRSRAGSIQLVPVEGQGTLTTPHSKVLGRDSFKGMGADFGDLNGDGWLDIFVSNIANEFALEESHFAFVGKPDPAAAFARGIAPFADESERLGLARSGFAWESRLADFDNDGTPEALQAVGFLRGRIDRWPELQELAMGNNLMIRHPASWPWFSDGDDISGSLHNPFFARAHDGRYFDIATHIGLGALQVSRGIAVADVDGDGDLDYAVANQWDTSYLFLNRGPAPGGSLRVRPLLRDSGSRARGRPAIGAHGTVTLPDGRRLIAQVDGGNGHSGARAPELHFGLGSTSPGAQVRLDLRWRSENGRVRQATYWLPAAVAGRGASPSAAIPLFLE